MSQIFQKPIYPFDPIWSVDALSRAIHTELTELVAIAGVADRSYRRVKMEPGSTREVFSALPRLKIVQKRIKEEILQHVKFPDYLTGSVRGRDYVTNAKLHTGAHILICEDVTKFFPSVSAAKVWDIWRHFFGFSNEVADLLTALTTKSGGLPQGANTSSYLANLVLWRDEPKLHAKLAEQSITYSRYVDDISISATSFLAPTMQERIIADVYGMLRRNGLSAKRKKHEIFSRSHRMIVTKVIVNEKPSWSRDRRSAVRTQVYELEQRVKSGVHDNNLRKFADSTANLVGQLGRFHERDANFLRARVRAARKILNEESITTFATSTSQKPPLPSNNGLPWES